jgi:transposase
MPKTYQVRPMTAEERTHLEQLSHSRTAPVREVERARIIWWRHQGQRPSDIARHLNISPDCVTLWVKRFNAAGLLGLADQPRAGRPATYSREQVGLVLATALTDPQSLGLPFGCWTLDRLVAYLHDQHGLTMKRSRIDEILLAEGLRWRQHETWFGARVDPDFAQKRGPSSNSTPPHPPTVPSSV